jgi:hypothetical protein
LVPLTIIFICPGLFHRPIGERMAAFDPKRTPAESPELKCKFMIATTA